MLSAGVTEKLIETILFQWFFLHVKQKDRFLHFLVMNIMFSLLL